MVAEIRMDVLLDLRVIDVLVAHVELQFVRRVHHLPEVSNQLIDAHSEVVNVSVRVELRGQEVDRLVELIGGVGVRARLAWSCGVIPATEQAGAIFRIELLGAAIVDVFESRGLLRVLFVLGSHADEVHQFGVLWDRRIEATSELIWFPGLSRADLHEPFVSALAGDLRKSVSDDLMRSRGDLGLQLIGILLVLRCRGALLLLHLLQLGFDRAIGGSGEQGSLLGLRGWL